MNQIIYICLMIFFIPVVFKTLQAMRVEQIFAKGKVNEIRVFYVIITLILSKLTADAIFVIYDKVNLLTK